MANIRVLNNDGDTSGIGGIALTNPGDSGGSIASYQYPLTIQNTAAHSNYLVFYAVEATGVGLSNNSLEARSQASVTGKFKENTIAVIQLYMPNMVENISHNYDENEGGFIQDLMMNMSKKPGNDKLSDAAGSLATTVIDTIAVNAGKVGQAFNAQSSGKVLGGRTASMYKSSAPRSQNFMFQLRPRNLSELKQVGGILKTFMIHSAAKHDGSASFDALFGTDVASGGEGFSQLIVPPLWFAEERINKEATATSLRHTPKFAFGPAAITNVRMNKTPDQVYESFAGTAGDPIAIDLEITMTELRPQFKAYYENLTAGLGKADSGDFFFGSFSGGVK